ncbi:MAG: helix-turn-helix domain-containing protein [Fusicatenibacter sp.]|jgi:excisionase family DNA binding protein|nr:helix-turn-helix domain-containing protein [Fusicatenibacter sp.]
MGQVKALAVGSVKSVKEASERWNISERWIQKLCEEGRIEGVQRFGRSWMIPKEAQKPADLRKKQKRKE